jgi:hypothetical protein
LSENNSPGLSHGLTRQNTNEDFDRLNILAHHILAPFSPTPGEGKKMMGKNISSFSEKLDTKNEETWPYESPDRHELAKVGLPMRSVGQNNETDSGFSQCCRGVLCDDERSVR